MTEDSTKILSYAGFWHRFFALLIDGFIIIIPTVIFNSIIPVAGALLASVFYKPFFESSALQATPGKAILGLQVVNLAGQRISFKQSFLRFVMSFVSSAIMMLGYIISIFTDKRQTLHDLVAGTLVIRKASSEINYLDAWFSEVKSIFAFSNAKPPTTNPNHPLEELHQLFTKGLITEAEYQDKKAEILKRL
ncbi:MAG: RDD family protein [Pseudobdellovibrionaceae bacterium]